MHKIIQNSKMTADKSSFLNKQKQQQQKKKICAQFLLPLPFSKTTRNWHNICVDIATVTNVVEEKLSFCRKDEHISEDMITRLSKTIIM